MVSNSELLEELSRSLRRARSQHGELLRQVEETRLAFEARSRELQTLETRIAELERRYHEIEQRQEEVSAPVQNTLRPGLLIANPNSGVMANGGELLDEIIGQLRAHGIRAEVGMKKSAKGSRKLAQEAAAQGRELVIVAGGDGTIEDVASQLVGSQTTLGIIPVGTMNNIARSLGIPLIVRDACELLGMGVTRRLDIGRVHAHAQPELEYFLETAGVGLSAIAIPAGDMAKSGRWEAIPDALRKLFNVKPKPLLLEMDDGQAVEVNSQIITVSNAPLIGNNILVAPDARMDDGLLDVAVYEAMNKAELLAHFVATVNGNRDENAKVKFYRARRVRIRAPEPIEVHSDKDLLGPRRTVEIEVIPACLSTIVGKGPGLTIPVEAVPSVPPLSGPQPENGRQI